MVNVKMEPLYIELVIRIIVAYFIIMLFMRLMEKGDGLADECAGIGSLVSLASALGMGVQPPQRVDALMCKAFFLRQSINDRISQ